MAVRARLVAPKEQRQQWNWHTVTSASLSASMLFSGDRRMEAEAFLSDGYNVRTQIAAIKDGWAPMSFWADVTQPNRLKGILVSPDHGIPFLASTQIFDLRPKARKWLALDRTDNAVQRYVKARTILVTRSGTVGRATIAQDLISHALISDDLLRVAPKKNKDWGWLYAYLRADKIIKLMQSAHYGHIIKHLEVSHLNEVPVIDIDDVAKARFNTIVEKIFRNRNDAEILMQRAEILLRDEFQIDKLDSDSNFVGEVSGSDIFSGRRRLEGAFHARNISQILGKIKEHSKSLDRLEDLTSRVWWMTRFSRNFGDQGVPYMSADELFSVGQIGTKRIFTDPIPNSEEFFVKEGWLLMACSGQIYGLNGSVTLATKHDENYFFSHDLIRIAPDKNKIRSGYLFAYLGHPDIGQALVKRVAYGSSIPHIDPADVASLPVPRLSEAKEAEIADLAERASELRAEAAALERQVGEQADNIITTFIDSKR